MKLASLRTPARDGALVVVRSDNQSFVSAAPVAATMQAALDDWERAAPRLAALAAALDGGTVAGQPLDARALGAPLPRAYEWIDGSAYLNHVILVRKARGADPPATLYTDPLVYQGGSGVLLGPCDDIPLGDPAWGLDFEAEVAVILGDTPRNLVPDELAKGFGFVCSKPATAFSPLAVTPDELGPAWRDARVHLPLRTTLNGQAVGDPDAGPEMHFSFADLIAHLARTRAFTAGTILGSGTVSNADPARGVSCLAERRARESIASGQPATPYLKAGDAVAIEMLDGGGRSVFGRIEQRVVAG
jgi:fumarylacetoacetate (FAA) hydrolase